MKEINDNNGKNQAFNFAIGIMILKNMIYINGKNFKFILIDCTKFRIRYNHLKINEIKNKKISFCFIFILKMDLSICFAHFNSFQYLKQLFLSIEPIFSFYLKTLNNDYIGTIIAFNQYIHYLIFKV